MGGGGGPSPEMMRQRAMEVVKVFKEKQATSQESAKTMDELGLPPHFTIMMQMRLGPLGVIVEKEGKYWLNEDNISKL